MRQLVRDDPFVREYKVTCLLATGYLGEALYRGGRMTEAAGLLREATEQANDALGGSGKDSRLLAEHGHLLHVQACLERDTGNLPPSLETYQQARAKLEQARKEFMGGGSLRCDWLATQEELARGRFLMGHLSRAGWIEEQQATLAERKDLARIGPPAPRFHAEVAGSAADLAGLLLEAGRPDQALACVTEVLPGYEQLLLAERNRAVAQAAANEQPAAGQLPAAPDRRREDEHAILMPCRPVEPEDLELRHRLATLLARRGAALARLGQDTEAGEAVRQAIGITQGLLRGDHETRCPPPLPASVWSFLAEELCRQEPCYLYDLACHLALASTLPGDAGVSNAAGRAVQVLRDYAAAGFDNAHRLRTDPALETLRQRADFQVLVRYLEAKAQGRTAPP
jgi:tetratricopeptide (TPR) repeat protein